jgi:hypothetical protein
MAGANRTRRPSALGRLPGHRPRPPAANNRPVPRRGDLQYADGHPSASSAWIRGAKVSRRRQTYEVIVFRPAQPAPGAASTFGVRSS